MFDYITMKIFYSPRVMRDKRQTTERENIFITSIINERFIAKTF